MTLRRLTWLLIIFLSIAVLAGCSITAERYKVPTTSAHRDGNPERIANYQCKDGYWKVRDARGVLWCDSTDDYERYPLDQEAKTITCERGSIAVVEKKMGDSRWHCAAASDFDFEDFPGEDWEQ